MSAPTDESNKGANNFMRALTPEQLELYTNIKGPGSRQRKLAFRQQLSDVTLTNHGGNQQQISSDAQVEQKVGTYRSYWQIAEKEGGLMCREAGMKAADNITEACTKRGPPMVMYDEGACVLKYMHCEIGVSDMQTKMRQNILNAKIDMDPQAIALAMETARKDGLIAPESANLKGSEMPVADTKSADLTDSSKPKGDDATNKLAGATPDTKAMMQQKVAAALQDGSPRKILSALLLSQIADQAQPLAAEQPTPDKTQAIPPAPQDAQAQAPTPAIAPAPAPAPPGATGAPPDTKKQTQKVTKSPEEKLFASCMTLGKKLDGMITHGNSVVSQSVDKDNLWHWARNETSDLEAALYEVQPTNMLWASKIRTSNVHVLKKEMKEKTLEWLEGHKKEIDSQVKHLNPPLSELISMHNARLKRKAPVDKPVAIKNVKTEPADEA